jgi:hypothetical protein
VKALTVTQPWATLIASGAKRIETRGWATRYRGPLAIHASKGFPRDFRDLCYAEPFASALSAARIRIPEDLPRAAVIATCELVEVLRIGPTGSGWRPPSEPERTFGDYSDGRYAWMLANVQPVLPAIVARGALGLWEWDEALVRSEAGS